jgi:DNA-binding PadR family transcriptional regulator
LDNQKTIDAALKAFKERIIKSFLDILILDELQKSSLSGYDIIEVVYNRYNITLSAGTVYSLLYKLERDNLIEPLIYEKKRTYKLTKNGNFNINILLNEPYIKQIAEEFRKSNSNHFIEKKSFTNGVKIFKYPL